MGGSGVGCGLIAQFFHAGLNGLSQGSRIVGPLFRQRQDFHEDRLGVG